MSSVTYPTARAVSKRVELHFSRHLAAARKRGKTDLAPPAGADTIQTLVDAAFWASLRREEGLTPKVSLAFLSPDHAGQALLFAEPLALTPAGLARVAPAVERPGIHLGVWPSSSGELRVWGTTRMLPLFCMVIEVIASGLLVVKHRAESFGKFVNVAVLEGDQIKIVDEGSANIPDCHGVLRSLLGTDGPRSENGSVNVMVLLAASMRAHGRGGALLVVPAGSTTWRDSVVSPVLYSVHPPFAALTNILKQEHGTDDHEWQEDLRRAVDGIAGLTAVDGATLINDRYELLAFGTKMVRRRGNPPVEKVLVTEPIEGSVMAEFTPVQLGGTRHLSAAQFVHDQQDASALVASQDGRFTIFSWSSSESSVHAHRVEALLL